MKRIYEDRAYGAEPIAESFWLADHGPLPDWPAVEGEVTAEVAVIGAGFTGLNAALRLAEAGVDVAVIDAEAPGWGASGRNGGFCCLGGAKAGDALLRRRFGAEGALEYHRAERAAVEYVSDLLAARGIDADRHSDGETLLAHRPRDVADMHALAAHRKQALGVDCAFLPKGALAEHGFASPEFHGALTTPVGFALNPLKYALGLAAATKGAGARIFARSPVTALARAEGRHVLTTPGGRVRARKLLIATNGYSAEDMPPWLAGRYMPVQSNILVTRPLTDDELRAQGWTSLQASYDSRRLLHYFRLMPNRRMLFGLRGATRSTTASDAAVRAGARADFERIFPAWAAVETPCFWSGLVCLARDLTPYVGPVPGLENAWISMAYHGNGVAMGSWSGHLAAARMLGLSEDPTPAAMARPLRRFELGGARRALLPLVYGWYGWRDRR